MKSSIRSFYLVLAMFTFQLSAEVDVTYSVEHHPIFEKFPNVGPQGFDEEYFEWIDLLEAVFDAKGSFNMVEVGAGYGRWAARGGVAARFCGLPFHLTLVEAEPYRSQIEIHEEMKRFGIHSYEYKVVPAAVGKIESSIFFYITSNDGSWDLNNWFGQCIMVPSDYIVRWTNETHLGQPVAITAYNYKAVEVKQLRLSTILTQIDSPIIDLCDFDVQGNEFDVISESIDILNARVKRMHIGTHGLEIEQQLRVLLKKNGWRLIRDYSLARTNQTEYGPIEFCDGVQSWINLRLN
ncbi:FkbM family methyltransferase [Simkania negevensis]|uniref:Methyltransferase FkbM domain-containing protein n=1 Tax=Simkania negevensis (strain ATCC VR-1471 / DSM 27360 / Z) TaxID=331113 RepID=F8L9M3_SIMNZ|nr:FkbM family methyltransferase [Simkania negevensis]CCB89560.1 hypothetical protein SNE_A16830 [Simkania negevensis Z]